MDGEYKSTLYVMKISNIVRRSGKSFKEILDELSALVDFGISAEKAFEMIEEKYVEKNLE